MTLSPIVMVTAIAGGSLHDRISNSLMSGKLLIKVVHTTVSQSSRPLALQLSSSLASTAICCNAKQVVAATTSGK